MTYAVALACGILLLGVAVFCITGHPKPLHLWWDDGDLQCFRCKMCSGCVAIDKGIHNQRWHHPRLYDAGLLLAGGAVTALVVGWVGAIRRRRPSLS